MEDQEQKLNELIADRKRRYDNCPCCQARDRMIAPFSEAFDALQAELFFLRTQLSQIASTAGAAVTESKYTEHRAAAAEQLKNKLQQELFSHGKHNGCAIEAVSDEIKTLNDSVLGQRIAWEIEGTVLFKENGIVRFQCANTSASFPASSIAVDRDLAARIRLRVLNQFKIPHASDWLTTVDASARQIAERTLALILETQKNPPPSDSAFKQREKTDPVSTEMNARRQDEQKAA